MLRGYLSALMLAILALVYISLIHPKPQVAALDPHPVMEVYLWMRRAGGNPGEAARILSHITGRNIVIVDNGSTHGQPCGQPTAAESADQGRVSVEVYRCGPPHGHPAAPVFMWAPPTGREEKRDVNVTVSPSIIPAYLGGHVRIHVEAPCVATATLWVDGHPTKTWHGSRITVSAEPHPKESWELVIEACNSTTVWRGELRSPRLHPTLPLTSAAIGVAVAIAIHMVMGRRARLRGPVR